jgi:hypothetical protein
LHVVHNQAQKIVRIAVDCKDSLQDAKYLQQAFFMPFHKAYQHVLAHRRATFGQFGPLDLRAACLKPLFACYLCNTKDVSWDSIRSAGGWVQNQLVVKLWLLSVLCLRNRHPACGPKA